MLRAPSTDPDPALSESLGPDALPSPTLTSRLLFRRRQSLPHNPGVFHAPWHGGVKPRRRPLTRMAYGQETVPLTRMPGAKPAPQPPEWSWDQWGRRSIRDMGRLARVAEMIGAGLVGSVAMVAIMAIPSLTSHGDWLTRLYPFTLPLGAAVGMLGGYLLVWKRWRLDGDD